MYRCPHCHNSDENYIGYINSKPYCRKCIKFNVKNKLNYYPLDIKDVDLNLKYPLSSYQEDISNQLVNDIENNDRLLVYAVCGAGKTEIIIKVIQKYLKKSYILQYLWL